MAWQNSAGMGGSGGNTGGGIETGNNAGQPHGTEYTLQGEQKTLRDIIAGDLRACQVCR